MNWQAMMIMAIVCVGASLIASLGVWLIDRGVHPYVLVGSLFLVAIIAVGVLA